MNFTTFLDTVGRTIIGELVSEDEKTIKVKNPVIVNIAPQKDDKGNVKMAIQLFPIFLRELLGDRSASIEWVYQKNLITLSTTPITLDFRLTIQYQQLFAPIEQGQMPAPQPTVPAANQSNPEVIKLFDD